MTNDPNPPGMPEPENPSPVGDAMADAKAAFNKAGFSTPSGMVALSGLILLGVEILFGVIFDEYGNGPALLGAAIAAVALYYASGTPDRTTSTTSLLRLLGWVIAGLVAFSLIYDLRNASDAYDEILDILGSLFTYAAGVLAFLGARAIK